MKKLKVLVTAEILPEILNTLNDRLDFTYAGYFINHEVMPHDELKSIIGDFDILVCEYDTINADILDATKKLKLIICCRGGVDSVIDLAKAMEKKIIVCNNRGRNANAVSDMTMTFILVMTRNVMQAHDMIFHYSPSEAGKKPAEYQDVVWGLDNDSPFIKFRGKSINHMTLGVVGFGAAGRLVAKKAICFGMKVIAYDPYLNPAVRHDGVEIVSFDTLLSDSDIISLHCISSPQTKNMFNEAVFQKIKPGSFFINTARGSLVNEEDLVKYLNNGHLAGAALDVTSQEPIPADSPLLTAKNILLTPHIAGSSFDVQYTGTHMVQKSLTDYLEGRKPDNCVVYI